jgi:hypothetical protein
MTGAVRAAIIADGSSDAALRPVITWSFRQAAPNASFEEPIFAIRRNDQTLDAEIARVRNEYKPNIVFVHRDAEREDFCTRRSEIPREPDLVAIVPVRMTEAWLLIDEQAIRRAADNPNGRVALDMPPVGRLEDLPDPKEVLQRLLVESSELPARRKKRFDRQKALHRVAELIEDFSPLRRLSAFNEFWNELCQALDGLGVR